MIHETENNLKHVVVIIGHYYPEALSTSICAINVINELKKNTNIRITCVCTTISESKREFKDDIQIYRIHYDSFYERTIGATNKAKKTFIKIQKRIHDLISICDYPDTDSRLSKIFYKALYEINSTSKIDSIVAVYMPIQAISATVRFKQHHPEIVCIGYYLDTLRGNKPAVMPQKIFNKAVDRYDDKCFSKLDKMVLLKYSRETFPEYLINKYISKITFLDVPSLIIRDFNVMRINNYVCSFVGTTYREFRNPLFAMKVFERLRTEEVSPRLIIYGNSNMKEELVSWQNNHANTFSFHGLIPAEEIVKVYSNSDYMINIANSIKGVVPGKTFELIGTLKPIIHFTDVVNDSSYSYFKNYPNVCIVDTRLGVENAVKQISDFFNKPYSLCDRNEILKRYSDASPISISEEIIKLL